MFEIYETIEKLQAIPSTSALPTALNFDIRPNERCVYLRLMISPKRGSGFGTKAMRCLVQLSQEKGYGGAVKLEAGYSSHLYYLYMGMIPLKRNYAYGTISKNTLNQLAECKNETDLQKMDANEIQQLALILSIQKENITPLKIMENQSLLLALIREQQAYLQCEFIPKLLDLLDQNIGKKYPDSSDFGGVMMTLSEEGKTRWLKAIQEDKPFELFKNFEPLRPYMTDEQIQLLDEILIENQLKINSKAEAATNTDPLKKPLHGESLADESEKKFPKISEGGLGLFNKKSTDKQHPIGKIQVEFKY